MSETSANDRYFLSYSRSDEHLALRIAKALRSRGVEMWVDQLDIRPSEHWDRAIERAVRDCRGLIVIVSPRSVASENVADEISYAIEHNKTVLPVMIEKCSLPLRITRMHVIDATGAFDRAVDQCVAELKRTDRPVGRPSRTGLNPRDIATAKQHLTGIIGPIGAIIVDRAASRAATISELNSILMQHIEDPADRARFAGLTGGTEMAPTERNEAGSTGDGAISDADLEHLAEILAAYLGPIAPILARRESQGVKSLTDLRDRLAGLIPESDRAAFLARLQAD